MPPHDRDAEEFVLSLLATRPERIPPISAMLTRQDFFSEAYGLIFEAIVALHVAGVAPDPVTVGNKLRESDRLAQVGGLPGVTDVLGRPAETSNAMRYAKIVRSKSRRRATIVAAQRITAEGYADEGADDEFLLRAQTLIQESSRLSDDDALRSNAESLNEIVKGIERAGQTGQMITGIPTGIDRYDRMTLGLHAKHLTVIGARPGNGKTALGATIAANVASTGIGVLFFSLEMSREEILHRLLSAYSGIDGLVLKAGRYAERKFTSQEWASITEASRSLAELPLWIEDKTGVTVQDIRSRCFGAIDQTKRSKTALGLVTVDYLQKVKVLSVTKKGRYELVGEVAAGLKQLARETSMPVIALTQLRRPEKGKENSLPTMNELRESGDIEQEADNITLIHAPEEDRRELLIAKCRGGRRGMIAVSWRPELTWFANAPDGPGEEAA
jgi:replicative DNA helicase